MIPESEPQEEPNFKSVANPLWNIVAQAFVTYSTGAAIEWLQNQGIEPIKREPKEPAPERGDRQESGVTLLLRDDKTEQLFEPTLIWINGERWVKMKRK